ncbi:MAG: peptidoglycan DD-metalloendopeptidase family protein, partial [Clostridia bacterium]|nr:peptidoglycan DD-metalloendopeptidase family protein [Clostridia bacterium]
HTITNITAEAFANVNVQTVKIRAGDVDDSSEIELDDLVELNEHIGEVLNDSNKVFDLNEDGEIDVLDRKLIKANYHRKAIVERWINAEKEEMILPLEEGYTITSEYGYRVDPFGSGETVFHSGIDMVGEHHEEVKAVLSGEVTYAGVQSGYGNCVEIKHTVDGVTVYSFYAHLSKIDVSVGEFVQQGTTIGEQGGAQTDPNPGSSTGEHLHFELRSESGSGHSLNPHDYLEL